MKIDLSNYTSLQSKSHLEQKIEGQNSSKYLGWIISHKSTIGVFLIAVGSAAFGTGAGILLSRRLSIPDNTAIPTHQSYPCKDIEEKQCDPKSPLGWEIPEFMEKRESIYLKLLEEAYKGNAKSQQQVALMLSVGDGVRRSEKEAIKWLETSARQGYQPAIEGLQNRLRYDKNAFEALAKLATDNNSIKKILIKESEYGNPWAEKWVNDNVKMINPDMESRKIT